MLSINGKNFSGSNVVVINGQIVNEGEKAKTQKFDEIRSEDVNNVEEISIYSTSVDVNILVSDSSKIEAHFYGQAELNGEVHFDVRLVNGELKIILNLIGSSCNSNLRLDVTVPQKIFKEIFIQTLSADITLSKKVLVDFLKLKTQSGDMKTNASFSRASLTTKSGDVKLYINASKNIDVEIYTMSGDVLSEFNNVSHINLFTNSLSGKIGNLHKEETGYIADVDIFTMSGDIKVK